MKYKIYFDLFGKKMLTTIEADSIAEAELKLRSKIKIHKVEPKLDGSNPFQDMADSISDIFKKHL